jgi:DNA-binding NtrC family response regulator
LEGQITIGASRETLLAFQTARVESSAVNGSAGERRPRTAGEVVILRVGRGGALNHTVKSSVRAQPHPLSDTLTGVESSCGVASGRHSYRLFVVFSPDSSVVGRSIELQRGHTLFVGRQTPGGLSVQDERMSKEHLVIAPARDGFACQDAGSTNGTFLNGSSSPGAAALEHGDVIRAGNTLLVVGSHEPLQDLREQIGRAATSHFPILLLGETGTGKELSARALHEQSGRTGAFVPLNCATLSRELAGAELFGHARGAFSGATNARPGLFRSADGGTLFLDEIGDLPLELQAAFLRVLEEGKVRPLGSDQEVPVDVRVLSATHVDLELAVENKLFRSDLLARLAHVVLRMPPLRERRSDILALALEFAPEVRFSANAAEALLLWHWPRNVRELRTTIETAALLSKRYGSVGLGDLAARIPAAAERVRERQDPSGLAGDSGAPPPQAVQRRARLHALLETHRGNVSKVAEELGTPRAQVYRWAKALGLDVEAFRRDP